MWFSITCIYVNFLSETKTLIDKGENIPHTKSLILAWGALNIGKFFKSAIGVMPILHFLSCFTMCMVHEIFIFTKINIMNVSFLKLNL